MHPAFLPCAPPPSRPFPRLPSAARPPSTPLFKPSATPLRPPRSLLPRDYPTPPRMSLSPESPTNKILQGPLDGRYGPWYFRQSDATDVLTYRVSLSAMAVSASTSLALALTAHSSPLLHDALYFATLAFFGVALDKIHIYMKPMHNLLKALWLMGVLGSVALSVSPLTGAEGLVQGMLSHPALLLGTGWWFVALTGLFVKEAACFGRLEAIALIFLVPALTGGHFVGLLSRQAEVYGGVVFSAVFVFFAIRKLLQDALDDVGDMSVFEHLAKGGEL